MSIKVTVTSASEYRFQRKHTAHRLAEIISYWLSLESEPRSLLASDVRVELLRKSADQFNFPPVAIDITANRCDELVKTLPTRVQRITEAVESSGLFPYSAHGPGRIQVLLQLVDGAQNEYFLISE